MDAEGKEWRGRDGGREDVEKEEQGMDGIWRERGRGGEGGMDAEGNGWRRRDGGRKDVEKEEWGMDGEGGSRRVGRGAG